MNYIYHGKQDRTSIVGAVSIFYIEDGQLFATQTMQAWLDQENWVAIASTCSNLSTLDIEGIKEVEEILKQHNKTLNYHAESNTSRK